MSMERSRKRTWLVVVLLVLTAGCGRAPDATGAAAAPPAEEPDGPATVDGTAAPHVVVALEPAGAPAVLPEGPAILDQYSKQFVPDLLFVRVGQQVEFRNSDDSDHNVQVLRMPTGTTVMNESGSQGQVFHHVFQQAGIYEVNCDVHPGMRSTIVATATPYAALTNQDGRFALANVPPGEYVLRSTLRGREVTRDVTVRGPRTTVSVR